MLYEIIAGKKSNLLLPVILDKDGIVRISEKPYNTRQEACVWVAGTLAEINPNGPVSMTRKKVYNERAYGKPMFWEITAYRADGTALGTAQWRGELEERHLSGLVQGYFSFPLETAEEVI